MRVGMSWIDLNACGCVVTGLNGCGRVMSDF